MRLDGVKYFENFGFTFLRKCAAGPVLNLLVSFTTFSSPRQGPLLFAVAPVPSCFSQDVLFCFLDLQF